MSEFCVKCKVYESRSTCYRHYKEWISEVSQSQIPKDTNNEETVQISEEPLRESDIHTSADHDDMSESDSEDLNFYPVIDQELHDHYRVFDNFLLNAASAEAPDHYMSTVRRLAKNSVTTYPDVEDGNKDAKNDGIFSQPESLWNDSGLLVSWMIMLWCQCFKISDNSLHVLLQLLHSALNFILSQLSKALGLNRAVQIPIPSSAYMLWQSIRMRCSRSAQNDPRILRYLMCLKCGCLYPLETMQFSEQRKCRNNPFPGRGHACNYDLHVQTELENFVRENISVDSDTDSDSDDEKAPALSISTPTTGVKCFKPASVMPIIPLIQTFQSFLRKPQFLEEITKSGVKVISANVYPFVDNGSDILFGDNVQKTRKYWEDDFRKGNVIPLFLSVNVDWFNPYKRSGYTNYSIGAMFMAIISLERKIRFKEENIVLWGLTPGPKMPASTNYILKLLVDELIMLSETGIEITTHKGKSVRVKVYLVCCACDMQGQRKILSFASYSAGKPCPFCSMFYNRKPSKTKQSANAADPDWGQYRASEFQKSRIEDVFRSVRLYCEATSITARKLVFKETGYKFSQFIRLRYTSILDLYCIDSMHALFEGVIKDFWIRILPKNWRLNHLHVDPYLDALHDVDSDGEQEEFLPSEAECNASKKRKIAYFHCNNLAYLKYTAGSDKHWRMDNERANMANHFLNDIRKRLPNDVTNIKINFLYYFRTSKASELMCFAMNFASIVLRWIGASKSILAIWELIYEMTCLILSDDIQKSNICRVHEVGRNIHDLWLDTFGSAAAKPNVHQSVHYGDTQQNVGSGQHFWLFPHERWNNILGQFKHNSKTIEYTMMKKMLRRRYLDDVEQHLKKTGFHELVKKIKTLLKIRREVFENDCTTAEIEEYLDRSYDPVAGSDVYGFEKFPGKHIGKPKYVMLSEVHEKLPNWLRHYCKDVLTELNYMVPLCAFVHQFHELQIGRDLFTSVTQSKRSCYIAVNYQDDDNPEKLYPWIAEVQSFLYYDVCNCLDVKLLNRSKVHMYEGKAVFTFALVKWFNTPNSESIITNFSINEGATFILSSFAEQNATCIIPIHRIAGRVILCNWNGPKRLAWTIKRRISTS